MSYETEFEDVKFLKRAYEGVTQDELYDIENEFIEKEKQIKINNKVQKQNKQKGKEKKKNNLKNRS